MESRRRKGAKGDAVRLRGTLRLRTLLRGTLVLLRGALVLKQILLKGAAG